MQTPDLFELQIDGASSGFLSEAGRWAKILAIIGFIGSGIMVLIGLSVMGIGADQTMAGVGISGFGVTLVGFVYVILAIAAIFPYVYLYQFSAKIKAALQASDQELLNTSFSKIKSLFKFVGVTYIVMMALFVLGLIVLNFVAFTPPA